MHEAKSGALLWAQTLRDTTASTHLYSFVVTTDSKIYVYSLLKGELRHTIDWVTLPSAPGARRACRSALTAESAPPKDWRTHPVVGQSGPETVLEKRSMDHFVDEKIDVPLGPFVLRYWQKRNPPETREFVLRQADCDGPVLPITLLRSWGGGSLVMRGKDGVFTLSPSGRDDEPIAVVCRP